MKYFNLVCLLFLSAFLIACQTSRTEVLSLSDDIYIDSAFKGYEKVLIASEQEIFALDDEMRTMVATTLVVEHDLYKRTEKLLSTIFDPADVELTYTDGADLTARQAYHENIANCLSLTIMAYALAEEAGLPVYFQSVSIPEYWVRRGKVNVLTGHVNLLVQPKAKKRTQLLFGASSLVIDFDPYILKKSFASQVIAKKVIMAMFYNNKGAQALVDKDYVTAYAYMSKATKIAPAYSSGWSNLGLLYRFTGHLNRAELVYRHAMAIDKNNLTAMANLSILLSSQGNVSEAQELEQTLSRKRLNNPYYHALLADEAFYRGQSDQAVKHYKIAINLDKGNHEFYFALAKVYYSLDSISLAKRAMKKAIGLNSYPDIEKSYIAKLAFLQNKTVSQ